MTEIATLGGGCYWCLEAYFKLVEGVNSVVSGYSGGSLENPTAEQVYAGNTGHTEVVQLKFEPEIISYKEILEIFFVMHDPTTLNRQGNDVGEIYRSVIFYHDEDQKKLAKEFKEGFATELWEKEIVTAIEPFKNFYAADEYMQNYYENNPSAGYCQIIIAPKVQKLRQKFASKLKSST